MLGTWVILHQFCTDQKESKNLLHHSHPVREGMLCIDVLSKLIKVHIHYQNECMLKHIYINHRTNKADL